MKIILFNIFLLIVILFPINAVALENKENNQINYEIPSSIGQEYDDIYITEIIKGISKQKVQNNIENINEIYTIGLIGYNVFNFYNNNKVNIDFTLGILYTDIKISKNRDVYIELIIDLEYNRDLELKYNSEYNEIILMYWFR